MNRSDAVRAKLARWGLRAICLDCTLRVRWWPAAEGGPGGVKPSTGGELTPHRSRRLRDTSCPQCGTPALRSLYWCQRYPERARALRDEILRLRHTLDS